MESLESICGTFCCKYRLGYVQAYLQCQLVPLYVMQPHFWVNESMLVPCRSPLYQVQFEDYLVQPASLARIRASVLRLQEALQRKSTCDFTLESHVGAGKPCIINIAPVHSTQSAGKRAVEKGQSKPTTASPVVRREKQPEPSLQSGSKDRKDTNKGHAPQNRRSTASSVEGSTMHSQAVEQWQCSKCTLLNGMQLKQCTLCQAPKPPRNQHCASSSSKNTRGTTKEKTGKVSAPGRGKQHDEPRIKACRQFATGTCKYGANCRYRHERDGSDPITPTTQQNKAAHIGKSQHQQKKQQGTKSQPPQTGRNRRTTNSNAPAVSALLKAGGAVPLQKMNILGSVLGRSAHESQSTAMDNNEVSPSGDGHSSSRTSKNRRQRRSGGSKPQTKGATSQTFHSGKNARVESKNQSSKQSQKSKSKSRQQPSKQNLKKQTPQKKQPAQKRAATQQRPRSGLKFNANAKPFVPPTAGTS